MKLVYAIVRDDNEDGVMTQLTQHHFSITRLSTTGGFLRKGNVTLMIGAEDDKVQEVIDIIKKECGEHSVVLPGVVSRKKQMVTPLLGAMEEEAGL